jgi:hypothetical protein
MDEDTVTHLGRSTIEHFTSHKWPSYSKPSNGTKSPSLDFLWLGLNICLITPNTHCILFNIASQQQQGGGIAAAFASSFPHLFDGNIVFICSAGVMKVCLCSLLPILRLIMWVRKQTSQQALLFFQKLVHLQVSLCRGYVFHASNSNYANIGSYRT